jgi:hypothetical protein
MLFFELGDFGYGACDEIPLVVHTDHDREIREGEDECDNVRRNLSFIDRIEVFRKQRTKELDRDRHGSPPMGKWAANRLL